MKKHLLCWGVGLCLTLFAVGMSSCSKEETPQPEPTPQSALEELVADKYWTEELYFVRWVYGDGGSLKQDDQNIFEEFGIMGGGPIYEDCVSMGTLYVGADRRIYRYYPDKYGVYSTYYANRYSISYGDNGKTARIHAAVDSLRYMGAVTGVDMEVVEMHEDQIVFEVPVKPYIIERWELDEDSWDASAVMGIRVYWKQRSAHNFQYAEPLD